MKIMSEYSVIHLIVKGNVQGIGYRWFVKRTALSYGLSGWVRNLENGDVKVEAAGQKEKFESFIDAIKNNHPYANVNDIQQERIDENTSINSGFEIEPD